jgi:dihydropteroate synthase
MEHDGADFIDVGGMSTAPYLRTIVKEKTEIERVTRAIRAIQRVSKLPVSVDTCRASVAKAAFELGADILNDVTGLQHDASMAGVLEEYRPSVILCAYSKDSVFGNQIVQTKRLLRKSLLIANKSGIPNSRIAVDPAIGFFRKKAQGVFFTKISSDWLKRDLTILQNLQRIKNGHPLVVSVSRKSFIGRILEQDDPDKRLAGSLAAETVAVLRGADVVRTHNVKASFDAVQIAEKLKNKKGL